MPVSLLAHSKKGYCVLHGQPALEKPCAQSVLGAGPHGCCSSWTVPWLPFSCGFTEPLSFQLAGSSVGRWEGSSLLAQRDVLQVVSCVV